jgi:hypothetical protein
MSKLTMPAYCGRNGLWMAVALLMSCGGKNPSDTATSTVPDTCQSGTVVLSDAQNFSYVGDVALPVFVTASESDIEVCWDDLVQDIQCHDVDKRLDIDNVGLIRFPYLTHGGVEQGLSDNNLLQADISGYVDVQPTKETCIQLADMSFFGTPVNIEEHYFAAGGTYMLNLTTGTLPGIGARMIAFLEPTESSDVTSVSLPDGCGVLDFAADLSASQKVYPCTRGGVTLDWSGLTTDGLGNEYDLGLIDEVMIGFYEGMTDADVETRFLDLELMATRLYRLELDGGTTADLWLATMEDGTALDGFSGEGVWIAALRCTTCSNPAPLFLTMLEPMEGGS